MSSDPKLEPVPERPEIPGAAGGRAPLDFAAATFLGAFLLFQVQPLIAKFILPWFGGGPAVWTTCMLFFQVVLLGGYAYAYAGSRWLGSRAQAALHLALLALALACLPIIPSPAWKPISPDQPAWQILVLLAGCLGLPYFVLSATGPLMQEWFRRAQPGVSPYRLYALSNLGSLLALLSYPFVFEPAFARKTQAVLWSWGLGVFAVVCAACAWRLWRGGAEAARGGVVAAVAGPAEAEAAEDPSHWWWWLCLPACASVLLLATTNKICQDIAVIPFLWVLPLALYLLSFILCFDSPKWYRRSSYARLLWPTLAGGCAVLFMGTDAPLAVQIDGYVCLMFTGCMICHGELYRLRPAPQRLTAYYLVIAAGGALGGLFVGLAAPLIFPSYTELQMGWLACPALLALLYRREEATLRLGNRYCPTWAPVALGVMVLGGALVYENYLALRNVVTMSRNFYGVLRVFGVTNRGSTNETRWLYSGDITHGLQFMRPDWVSWLTTYYHEETGVGLAWDLLPEDKPRRVGMVGLGVGTLAAYGRRGDQLRFYEINPEVLQVALTDFAYLSNSPAKIEVILGDARLSLEREPPQGFDLLVLDAFSGDAIPLHLLTVEAMEIYLRHLAPGGVIAVHITNMHLELAPVVQRLAAQAGLRTAYVPFDRHGKEWWRYSAAWMLLTRNQAFLDRAAIKKAARPAPGKPGQAILWTDDHASLLKIFKR